MCDDFRSHISSSPLSMNGRLAICFSDLLKMMWDNKHTVVPPMELKKLIAERRPEFAGSQQHDAQEVLTFLLDGLHEDVNKAPYPRPIVDDPSIEDKEEASVAREAWDGNSRRNDSEIVDMFQFQIRSEITFPDVGNRSLKFDPMVYLSLPVPKPPHVVKLTVISLGYPEVVPMKCNIIIPKSKLFKDLEERLSQELPIESDFCLAAPRRFVFTKNYENRVIQMWTGDQPISDIRSYDDVCAFEVAEPAAPPSAEVETDKSTIARPEPAVTGVGAASSSCPQPSLEKQSEVETSLPSTLPVLKHVVVQLRKKNGTGDFVLFAPSLPFAYWQGVTTNADIAERVMNSASRFKTFFGNSDLQVTLTIGNMYSRVEGAALSSEGDLFQVNTGEQLCLNFHDLDTLLADSSSDQAIPKLPQPEAAPTGTALAGPKPDELEVKLEQCLDSFQECEELAQEEWVTCEKTKQVERSQKKLDIWNSPDCLIIHLKRFGSELLAGPVEKISTLVKAPVDLDLSPWIRSPADKERGQYRLYAVVNHTGSLSFGHYTAYGRVGEGDDRPWYNFNDSNVTKIDKEPLVSEAAYILFYERVNSGASCSSNDASNNEPS